MNGAIDSAKEGRSLLQSKGRSTDYGGGERRINQTFLSESRADAHPTPFDSASSRVVVGGARGWLDRRFDLTARRTTVWQEVRAGCSTFLTMAYIIVVNARLMGYPHSGIPRSDVMVGTAASSALATFVSGWFGNLPFALAPGLGLSAYMSMQSGMESTAMTDQSGSWQAALASCAVAGMIQIALATMGLSSAMMRGTPRSVQSGTVIGMGLLLCFVAVQEVGIIEGAPPEAGLLQLSSRAYDMPALLSFAGLILVAVLSSKRVPGAVLCTILSLTALSVWLLDSPAPQAVFGLPYQTKAFFAWDFANLSLARHLPIIVAFVLVGVFDVAGVLMGLSHAASLSPESESLTDNGVPKGSAWAFAAAGLGTVVGAALGSTPVIVHLESAAGISEGGRTGLTAVVSASLFALSLFAAPLLDAVPVTATAPVLIFVGSMMMGTAQDVNWGNAAEGLPAFLALTLIPLTFSVPNGVAFGAAMAAAINVTLKLADRLGPSSDSGSGRGSSRMGA